LWRARMAAWVCRTRAENKMSEQDLQAALSARAATVENCLDTLLALPEGPEARLMAAMRYAALGGGKRMRGFLVMEVAGLFGVSVTSAARVAASVEMLHAYSLVHDDLPCMDDDDLRRGKPSTHRAFDEATAVLAGDALQARAFEVLAEPDTHSDPLARAELVRCAARTASLEFDDCAGFAALRSDAGADEAAYAEYLAGRGERAPGEDPLSKLVSFGVKMKSGRITPAEIADAVDIASAQGWRRPLLAWLGVQEKRAQAAGDGAALEQIRRRIALVNGKG